MLLCIIINAQGAYIQKGSGRLIKVYNEQSAQILVGDDALVSAGVTLEINCNVNTLAEEITAIKWLLDGNELVFQGFIYDPIPNIRRYAESTLTIYSIAEKNEGEYTCVVINPDTNAEFDQASSNIELAAECMEGCQGNKGQEGVEGQRGLEGKQGKYGLPG